MIFFIFFSWYLVTENKRTRGSHILCLSIVKKLNNQIQNYGDSHIRVETLRGDSYGWADVYILNTQFAVFAHLLTFFFVLYFCTICCCLQVCLIKILSKSYGFQDMNFQIT